MAAPAWPLTAHAEFWLDPSGQVAAHTAMNARFQPIVRPYLGYRRGAVWLRLVIENPGPPVERLLRVGPALLEQVDLWQPASTRAPHQAGGLATPMARRALAERESVFPVVLPGGESRLFLRVASPSLLSPELELWQAPAWQREARRVELRTALMEGALLMVVLMAVANTLWTREWFWLYYALGIFAYALYEASYSGFAALWLWPGRPDWSLSVLPAALALALAMFALFFLRFVPSAGLHRAWRLLWGLPMAAGLGLALVHGLGYRIGMPMLEGVGLTMALVLPLFSLAAWRHGFRPARWAPPAFGLVYAATFHRIGALSGWWPPLFHSDPWLLPLSAVLGSGLLLLAQIDQLRDLQAAQLRHLAELATARDAARRANHAKSLILARVSHDLRTPLHTLTGYLELARREQPSGALARYLEVIARSGRNMLTLIEELLQFARGEEGRLELCARPTFLHALIQHTRAQGELLARSNANRFILDLDLAVTVAVLDGDRLAAVLMNLISNACRMTVDGTVTLAISGQNEGGMARLRFAVRDTGPGIASEDHERIFLAFERGRSGAPSSGLGLAIARQLVRLMGSELRLESQTGQGALFWFDLSAPVAEESAVPPPAIFNAPRKYEGAVRTLLVVDDIEENRDFLVDLLTGMNFEVLEADGVREALAMADANPLDGVIVDQYLDDGTGWEILGFLRKLKPELPVFLLSAAPAQAPKDWNSPLDFDACLLKPLNIEEFTQALGRSLGLVWDTGWRGPEDLPKVQAAPVGPVSREDLLTLRHLAREGSLFEVEDWIEQRRHLPEEAQFVEQIGALTASARLPPIVDLVDRRLSNMKQAGQDDPYC